MKGAKQTTRMQVIIEVAEPEPGQLALQVQGPKNPLLTLGILELAKAKITQQSDEPAREQRIVPAPAGLGDKLRRHFAGNGQE